MSFLSVSTCETGLDDLEKLLDKKINHEDPTEVSEHIAQLSAVQGFSSRIMASCEYHKFSAPSALSKATFTLSERINSGLGKSLLAYQSILSKLKEEIKLTR